MTRCAEQHAAHLNLQRQAATVLEYQLPVDVYLCRHDDYVVLMDLARDPLPRA
jgi:hypothetical protein